MAQHICTGPNCNCQKLDLKALELSAPQNDITMEKYESTKEGLKNEISRIEKGNNYRSMVHLHLHTYHSILDGAGSIDDYIKLAKEYNHPAITILDHGTLSGTFEFYQKCTKAGIKPILGMEAYINDKMGQFEEKKYEGGNTHQSILVKNEQGYQNINKLAYLSYTEGFYKRGRISTEMLLAHKEGLLITTSCMASAISRKLQNGQITEAEEYLKVLHKAFGDDLYAEIQFNEIYKVDDNPNYGQKEYNNFIIRMAKKYDIPVILTGDVHYAKPEDNKLQDLLIAINQQSKIGEAFALDARHLYYTNDKDFHEFNTKFGYNYSVKFIEQCLDNTIKVADKCNFKFDTETTKFPVYEPTPDVSGFFKTENTEEIIRKLAHGKLKQKLKIYREKNIIGEVTEEVVKEYTDRLNYELDVIAKKGMLDYFLVYWEIIRDYRGKGYDIGPGRGCFVPGSRVKMADGMYAPIETIEIGDEVIDAFGDIRKVIDTLEYDINEDIIELEMEDGRKITCTLDHEILTNNRGWVHAKDLTEEDDIAELDKQINWIGALIKTLEEKEITEDWKKHHHPLFDFLFGCINEGKFENISELILDGRFSCMKIKYISCLASICFKYRDKILGFDEFFNNFKTMAKEMWSEREFELHFNNFEN